MAKETTNVSKKIVNGIPQQTYITPEFPILYDWGKYNQVKMMTVRDRLVKAGNPDPSEAAIKAAYLAAGGKISTN